MRGSAACEPRVDVSLKNAAEAVWIWRGVGGPHAFGREGRSAVVAFFRVANPLPGPRMSAPGAGRPVIAVRSRPCAPAPLSPHHHELAHRVVDDGFGTALRDPSELGLQ